MNSAHSLESIRGYVSLAMYDKALEEWEKLSGEVRETIEAKEIRIVIELERSDFERALRLSRELTECCPDEHAGFIQGAYALHELGRTGEARDFLMDGPGTLREEPVYFYNLACYELALGKEDAAHAWLHRAFRMNIGYRKQALRDPDLAPLRDRILEDDESDA